MSLPRALGIVGTIVLIGGVFLPAVSLPQLGGTSSTWGWFRWTAVALLILAGGAIFTCGSKDFRFLLPIGAASLALVLGRLMAFMVYVSQATADNAQLATHERGWAGLIGVFIPSVHWLGWSVMALGAVLQLVAWHFGTAAPKTEEPPPEPTH